MKVFRVVQLMGGELHQVGRLYRSAGQAKGYRTRRINGLRKAGANEKAMISYSTRLAIQEAELEWKGLR